ncbi:MAG: cbb3-type cytochrome c oxidase subunit I [Verrucomicrobia bacterium]|nr:cbb3-type cytochrome c oxidase subunit I [Verrucomicrobiota bacterium]
MQSKGLRNATILTFIVSMAILLVSGHFFKSTVPPVPDKVVCAGNAVTDHDAIMRGQDVYQRYGLMDHGSIWGHGSLRGMDFAAHTLHCMGALVRLHHAAQGKPDAEAFKTMPPAPRRELDELDATVTRELKANRYDPAARTLELTPAQAYAFGQMRKYWEKTFAEGDAHYGFLPNTVLTAPERQDAADFFFWTAWAAVANRPGLDYSYTNNWPADRTVGNAAPANAMLWTIFSILGLFAVLGVVVYVVHRFGFFYGESTAVEAAQRLLASPVTASQRSSAKFFLVAGLLFILQIFNGGLLAHYTVHPSSFYVKLVGEMYPYSWAKSWHLQLAILWIALSWVGTAIYLAPLIGGREPRKQRLLVNILFVACVAVAVGSLAGEVLGIKGMLGDLWFWLGHQGWEYLELGRLWQILLFGGLVYWLVIVARAMAPVLKHGAVEPAHRSLIIFYICSAVFVVGFFAFGFMYGRGTHLSVADYWRWFVVHIWVESIFEFFGAAVISLFLVTLGLVSAQSALRVSYLTAILVFISGIPGTAHHYYWYGGPSFWLAIGGVFSSLEPIPLILLVVRAWMEYKSIHESGREFPYRWPLYFLTASSVWNFVGAGMFGFVINLPLINYYEHATYLTSNHGHTALFGVYGMLAIAVILFSWRGLVENRYWNDRILKLSFWGLNGGLGLMFLTGLLPIGIYQFWHCYDKGFWYARSSAFYDLPAIQMLGNWRVVPDMIIIVLGAFPLLYFLLTTYPRLRKVADSAGK